MQSLSEGLIKLPEELLKDLEAFALRWYFAHVRGVCERRFRFDEEALDRALRLVAQAERDFNVPASTAANVKEAKTKSVFMKTFKLKASLYGVDLDVPVKFRVIFDRMGTLRTFHGNYDPKTNFITVSPYNMHMTGPSITTIAALRNCLTKVPYLTHVIKHELTHLVQLLVLQYKHPAQVSGSYDERESGYNDDYVGSNLEFDPLIKSTIGTLKRLKLKYRYTHGYTASGLLNGFLGTGPMPAWMDEGDVSVFISMLKRRSPSKWRKAVKHITMASES